jgi:hypothetical protein
MVSSDRDSERKKKQRNRERKKESGGDSVRNTTHYQRKTAKSYALEVLPGVSVRPSGKGRERGGRVRKYVTRVKR